MHIADGILSAPVLAAGFVGTVALAGYTLRRVDLEDIPKISVVTSAFFVASLIHIPVGVSSLHLILNGLVGVILGMRAFPAILLGIILQAILFGHGGVTVIGVNTVMLGGGALCAYGVWSLRHHLTLKNREVIFGALAGAVGTFASGFILALALFTTGEAFWAMAGTILAYHLPLMFIEGAVAASCIGFIMRVKPEILASR
ncbi:MAG: cobalt/nickel transport system permease protein [Halothiobacillaceae bacterium]|nr:MAG: cobalt/nickel transport system permease protein [Halothiobacillaceae bacterium]